MPKGKPISIEEFAGLDLRAVSTRADINSFRIAKNLELTSSKGVRTRPGSRIIAQASEFSRGLYAANGVLYSVAPSGYPTVYDTQSTLLKYVFIGDGNGYDADYLDAVLGFETYNENSVGLGIPYVVTRNKVGIIEHHYYDDIPTNGLDITNTLVDLPFYPGPGLTKLSERLYNGSNADGNIHYCQIGDPRDWVASVSIDGPGFIPFSRHSPNTQFLQGMTYFRNLLVALFADSMQIWSVDTNQGNISLVEILNGPGTLYERALANVLGDTFYFSRGGFRSLRSASIEGERFESDIGVKIENLSGDLPVDPEPVAKWSQFRGSYLCSFGNQVLQFKYIPSEEVFGWTLWELPFTITDIVESGSNLFCRDSDHNIREFSDDLDNDSGVPVDWELKTQFIARTGEAMLWNFVDLSMGMDGEARIYAYPLQEAPDERDDLGVWSGTSDPHERVYLSYTAPSLAIGWAGTGFWQLDAFSLRVNRLEA